MFGLKSKPRTSPARVVMAPPGTIVWAIGDIHGQDDLLSAVLSVVLADLGREPGARGVVVFLGDYIDRGLGARRVVETILDLKSAVGRKSVQVIALKGNHEAFLLEFLEEPSRGPEWTEFGGRETMLAYGITPPKSGDGEGWAAAAIALRKAMTSKHMKFFSTLKSQHIEGDYLFVHAGLRPGVNLQDQTDHDRLWIREDFIQNQTQFDHLIVHGHTPTEVVHADGRRIGLDTGAYATGALSALRLQGQTRLVLQTKRVNGQLSVQSGPLLVV